MNPSDLQYFLALSALLLLLHIWLCLRIAQESTLFGVLCFFMPPLSAVVLARNWGRGTNDVRAPFFWTLVVLLVWRQHYTSGMDQLQRAIRSPIIADAPPATEPVMFQPAQRADILPFDQVTETSHYKIVAGFYALPVQIRERPADSPATHGIQGEILAPGTPSTVRAVALRGIERTMRARSGKVPLGPDRSIDLPAGFNFYPADQVRRAAELGAGHLDRHTLGWIVHERSRLADTDAWPVIVRFAQIGAVAHPAGDEEWRRALISAGGARSVDLPPQWYSESGVATSVEEYLHAGELRWRARAFRPVAGGLLEFTVLDLSQDRRELGLRAVRLLAMRTHAPAPANPTADGSITPLSEYALATSVDRR